MKKRFRLLPLCLTLISVPVVLLSATNAYASSYDNGYDDGYEDGYDDAMAKCPCPSKLALAMLAGFYFGGGLGYEGYQIRRSPWLMDDRIGTFNTHANGWTGRLFGGYGRYFNNNYYLGGEVFAGTSSASGTDKVGVLNYDGKFSVGTSLGASLIPGYKLSNGSLFYGRVGYIDTEFTVKDHSTSLGSNSSTKWVGGYNLGVGFEMPFNNRLSGRIEYDYMNYGSFNVGPGQAGSKNQPTDNKVEFDLKYTLDQMRF